MLSFSSRAFSSAGRFGVPSTRFRRLISFRPARILAGCLLCLLFFLILGPGSPRHLFRKKARFSLLVPATSSNSDLCKLLLSAQVLNYPTPILVNYGATEVEDAYVQHLAKVEGILNYLDALDSSGEYAEDLVLIVDGFDVWFQLHAETLLSRYYEHNAAANARIIEQYGKRVAKEQDMRQTIIFGPDKICWPIDYRRPACWAVPVGNLQRYAFGPETATELQTRSHPRWLNSGTILGPVQDLKALFRTTLQDIHTNHSTDSDQYYLAEVFGRQEFARLRHNPALMEHYKNIRYADEFNDTTTEIERSDANITEGMKTEFHIGIDYESGMFQTLAFWKPYLTWMRPVDSWAQPGGIQPGSAKSYELPLPADVQVYGKPFTPLLKNKKRIPGLDRTWGEMELLYNTVTEKVPALIHFTGEKRFRHIWWKKIWFQSHAKELREASLRDPSHQSSFYGPIAGYMWHNAEPPDAEEVRMHGVGGAWSDRGGWFSWKSLCRGAENPMFEVPDDNLFHPTLKHDEPVDESGKENSIAKNLMKALRIGQG